MKRIALALAILPAILVSSPALAKNVGDKLPGFVMKDSRGITYTLRSFKKRILVFWYEGKNSKEQNRWIKNKLKRLYDQGKINRANYESIGIANYQETAVPNWIISKVIQSEIKKTGAIILCDKTGKMMKTWGFRNGRSNIYVLDAGRRLRWKTSGPLNKRRGNQLIRYIMRLAR